MSSQKILFFNHFHTEKSTEYTERHTEVPEWMGRNHFGSPLKILEHLGEEQEALITITEHYETNGKEFFENLGKEVESRGGSYHMNDRCLILEKDGAKIYLINGVEASYKKETNHVVIAGLPLSDKNSYFNLNEEEIEEELEKAAYAHPAHPFMDEYGIEDETLDEICNNIKDSESELFIPYTTAYGSIMDGKARGTSEGDKTVQELAKEFEADLITELDHHVHLPRNLNGVSTIDSSASEKLEKGEIPVKEIRDADIIEATRWNLFKDWFRAGRTFADQLPNYMEWKGFWSLLSFPYGDEELLQLRDYYYEAELSDLDIEKLKSRSRPLNG